MGKLLTLPAAAGIAVIAGIALTNGSCSTTGCLENQNSLPLAGFYSSQTGQAISVDSVEIGGIGAPHDSLLLSSGSASEIYLPFRSTRNETSFRFRYTQEVFEAYRIADTITFGYESTPYFASEECGAMYHYRIRRVETTHFLIDSVGITDSLITNLDIQRIRIYFRTSDPDAEPPEEEPAEEQ